MAMAMQLNSQFSMLNSQFSIFNSQFSILNPQQPSTSRHAPLWVLFVLSRTWASLQTMRAEALSCGNLSHAVMHKAVIPDFNCGLVKFENIRSLGRPLAGSKMLHLLVIVCLLYALMLVLLQASFRADT